MPLDQRYFQVPDAIYYDPLGVKPTKPTKAQRIPGVLYGTGRLDYTSRLEAEYRLRRRFEDLETRMSFRKWNCHGYSQSWWQRSKEHHKLLDAHVKAVMKSPDRLDVLGELYALTVGTLAEGYILNIPEVSAAFIGLKRRDCGSLDLEPQWVKDRDLPRLYGYCVVALPDGNIEFFASVKHMLSGKRTQITPGRYLKRVYPTLPDHVVRDAASAHKLEYAVPEVKIARSESECIRVVAYGPESCMANSCYSNRDEWFAGHIHPAAVYGYDESNPTWKPDTEILYIEDAKGKIKARVICNAVTKACARIYGDENKMRRGLASLGYTQEVGALSGARIRRIENEDGEGVILPYVDAGVGSGGGDLRYTVGGDYLLLGEYGDRTYAGYENRGISHSGDDEDLYTCDSCGDEYEEDYMNVAHDGQHVCDGCRDEHYVYAIVRVNPDRRALVHIDNTTYVEGYEDNFHNDVLDEAGIYACEYSGGYFDVNDLVNTPEGWVHERHNVALDVEYDGCAYAMKGHTIETHDGRTIHQDHAIRDYFTGAVYCEDDDGLVGVVRNGTYYALTADSVLKHMDGLSVLDGHLVLGKAEGDAVPLRDYLLTQGEGLPKYPTNNPLCIEWVESGMLSLMTEVYERLTKQEETECEETEQIAA